MSQEIFNLQPFFEDVQMGHIFPDGKTFVDCIPKRSPASILQRYNQEKQEKGFDLSSFVHHNFYLPAEHTSKYQSVSGRPLIQHVEMLWTELTRQPDDTAGSLIPLPYPYIVPGGSCLLYTSPSPRDS